MDPKMIAMLLQELVKPGRFDEFVKYVEENKIDVKSYKSPHYPSKEIENGFAWERTFVHLAVIYKNMELLSWLMDKDIDINAGDSLRDAVHTALFFAAENDAVECAKFLLQHGASVNDESVIEFAARGSLKGVEALLATGHKAPNDLLHTVAKSGNKVLLDTLLNSPYNLDVNQRDKYGEIALHHANNEEIAKILLDHKSEVDALNNKGQTPLLYAANNCKTEAYKTLSATPQANEPSTDAAGNTALHLAAAATIFSNSNCNQMIDYLIEKGFDSNAKNHAGKEPIVALAGNMVLAINSEETYIERFKKMSAIEGTNPEALAKAYECANDIGYTKERLLIDELAVSSKDEL